MKKIMIFLLITSLLAALFCGCAEKTEPAASTQASTEAAAQETETTQTEAPEPELPEHYVAYRELCEERMETYGVGRFVTGNSGDSILTGLSVVRLLDFDGDGTEELLLVYMTDYDSFWNGNYEIWTYKNGEAVQADFSENLNSSNGGWVYLTLLERDGILYIVKEDDHSWDPDDPTFTEELWALNGIAFESAEKLVSAGIGINSMQYYLNDTELSQSEYDEKLNEIWQNSENYYVSVSYAEESITEGIEETLLDTEEVLQTLGVTSQIDLSENDIYAIAERCLHPGVATSHTIHIFDGRYYYRVCVYAPGASSYVFVDAETGDCYDGFNETELGTLLYRYDDLPKTDQSEPVTPEEAPSDDTAAYVGEWIVDWEQTQIVTGKYGQDMFGTSVGYGTSMVLTADFQISYAFSFYGGSGTYRCDGDRITVDSTPTDTGMNSPLRTLTPVYIEDKLYLCMDLSEVLPDTHAGEFLYWKLK